MNLKQGSTAIAEQDINFHMYLFHMYLFALFASINRVITWREEEIPRTNHPRGEQLMLRHIKTAST